MDTVTGAGDAAARGDPDEHVLDVYLDARLRGEAPDVAEFCARHGPVAPAMRARLEAIHAAAAAPRPGARDGAAEDGARAASDGAVRAAPPIERLGDFRLVRRLDEGGMGSVHLAVQESLRREVALKVVKPELRDSPAAVERFRREALAVGRIRHPNIVNVLAVGEERGVRYLAMELVPGRTLDEILAAASARGETVPADRALRWARDLARALHCAHEQGVVHRDVKPSNVRITPDDRPMLLDFGIARDEQAEGPALTQTFAGSPLYAAPEQFSGADLDARADVYGLAVTLYQCLTGRVPFAGGTMEEVLRRVLAEEPLAPRRLNPGVPRDVETVVLTALAKEPERRYATAAAFADDLDAVLASRPIRARPPGPLGRLAKWVRRRPARAAFLATSALAAGALAVAFAVNERSAANDRARRVGDAIGQARARLADYRARRAAAERTQREAADLRAADAYRYLTPEEDRALHASEAAAEAFHREREVSFQETLELLRFAERLDADATVAADDLRAELYRERWLEARGARDVASANFLRARVAEFDRSGRFADELRAVRRLDVRSDPPHAHVHMFRILEQSEVVPDGERRLVPVPPAGVAWPVAPGTVVLRVAAASGDLAVGDVVLSLAGRAIQGTVLVARGAGEVRRLDRLVAIDGAPVTSLGEALLPRPAAGAGEREFEFEREGRTFAVRGPGLAALGIEVADPARSVADGDAPAEVWTRGAVRTTRVPRGTQLRPTAAPVFVSAATAAGTTPLEGLEVEEGSWLLVLEAPGRERIVHAVAVPPDQANTVVSVRLPPAGETPPGFVAVCPQDPAAPRFAILEREVTSAEYLEFLNDPATLARIAASAEPVLFPRSPETRLEGGFWPRGGDGRFTLPPSVRPDWPVLGVSWSDARDYAAWRTARAAAAGRTHETYDLPTREEWVVAAGFRSGRAYAFGHRFSTKHVKCCFVLPVASPEPVMSYPVGESPFGVFDTSGSAFEWVDWWFDEHRGLRLLAGGSWAQTDPRMFQVFGGVGGRESWANGETGFRLVVRRSGAR